MSQSQPLFVYFRSFHVTNIAQIGQKMIKALMVCLRLKPGAAGWCAWDSNLGWQDGGRRLIH